MSSRPWADPRLTLSSRPWAQVRSKVRGTEASVSTPTNVAYSTRMFLKHIDAVNWTNAITITRLFDFILYMYDNHKLHSLYFSLSREQKVRSYSKNQYEIWIAKAALHKINHLWRKQIQKENEQKNHIPEAILSRVKEIPTGYDRCILVFIAGTFSPGKMLGSFFFVIDFSIALRSSLSAKNWRP